jgi:hypothetical protein
MYRLIQRCDLVVVVIKYICSIINCGNFAFTWSGYLMMPNSCHGCYQLGD